MDDINELVTVSLRSYFLKSNLSKKYIKKHVKVVGEISHIHLILLFSKVLTFIFLPTL